MVFLSLEMKDLYADAVEHGEPLNCFQRKARERGSGQEKSPSRCRVSNEVNMKYCS